MKIKSNICFECGANSNIHQHHVVPKTLGGKKTIPLCGACHGKVHNKNFGLDWKRLQMEGIRKIQKNQPEKYSGRTQNTKESNSDFLKKYLDVIAYLKKGITVREIQKHINISANTVTKIKKVMKIENKY
jgi:ribosome-binding protein aMBF1 (putative translation factor)